jgi:hypothetical protein
MIQRVWTVGKKVNGGAVIYLGSFPTKQKAEEAAFLAWSFHRSRCPNDYVETVVAES